MIKYIRKGGVVYAQISFVNADERFKGKTIFISGGSSGIGLEMCKEFLAEGAKVIIAARNKAKLEETQKAINSDKLEIIQWDIADFASYKNKFDELKMFDDIDVFINNAGVGCLDFNLSIKSEEYDSVVDVVEKGLYFMCQEEANYFIGKKKKGKIINTTSIAGFRNIFEPYHVGKSAANQITKSAAAKFISHGINVNGIAPGNVPTNISSYLKAFDVSDNVYEPAHPTDRITFTQEIAAVAKFLASDSANNIVGQIIAVDGGWTVKN